VLRLEVNSVSSGGGGVEMGLHSFISEPNRSGKLHTMAAVMYPWGKSPLYPLNRSHGWAPEPVQTFWRRDNLFPVRNKTTILQRSSIYSTYLTCW